MCVGREGELHTRLLASPGRPWRGVAKYAGTRRTREWSAEIRPLALRGRCFFLLFFVFGYLAFKSARYGILIGFLIFWNRSRREVVGLFYITDPSAYTKTHLIELGFCLSSLLRRLRNCSIPNAGEHRRMGEQVSGTARSCDPAPGDGE